jgi:hypothetical protein
MFMTTKFIVFDPTVAATQEESSLAPRLTNFEGLTIGILDNTKGPAQPILRRVAELMQQRLGAGEIVYYCKPTFGRVAANDVVDEMAGRCDLVLTALGD